MTLYVTGWLMRLMSRLKAEKKIKVKGTTILDWRSFS
jgi:hypothetical protein